MSGSSRAHRAGFTVRCACGNTFHSTDDHVGKRIRCSCGRTVTIEREPVATNEPKKRKVRSRKSFKQRYEKVVSKVENTAKNSAAKTANWLTFAVHDLVHPSKSRRYASRAAWGALALMIVTWALLVNTSEKFLPATLLAYGPRMVVLIPLAPLILWALLSARRALVPLSIALWVALFPIMGARFSPSAAIRSLPITADSGSVRIVSFNVLTGSLLAPRLSDFIDSYNPHIIGFQECGESLWSEIQNLKEWHSFQAGGLCTLSRWPMEEIEVMRNPNDTGAERGLLGGYGNLARYKVTTPNGTLVFVNLHLPTARYGLESLMTGDGFVPSDAVDAIGTAARTATGIIGSEIDDKLRSSKLARELASRRASINTTSGSATVALIAVGDFNLPVESTIYRDHWSHLSNAFEDAGNGLGWTKSEGKLLRIRIDHILSDSRHVRPTKVVIGESWGSDHRPVVADFSWRRAY